MIILGVDPGSVITGYSILKKNKDRSLEVVDFGCIITEKNFTTGERLKKIHGDIKKLIEKHKPDVMSVETLFFFKNVKTVMPVSQTKGVILLAGAEKKLQVMEFTPLQIKMAICGYGRAEKKQMQKMIEETVNLKSFDFKKNFRKRDDAFDAIGVAICAAIKSY
ncbi:MAG: crossover junction endodeoxyribonuclease RuvC [Candidatus Staskawiczbacteria bacterium RIFOXYD1_FULL_39_28]|uniref:Crossover junction endodeoxyribonuclease RuvC n=1 Tax=Candidatus Staskawiczbacteria bacterium RIFOXYC1_FULL_38_18 TaxID=1802229 RepID=A0A1G2JB34_9BACT|nr:MAG: crossover junction endodeoxyribonuclease RuvC [Candidatus Staskawiczbacteria bacterium RIFOXYC1_FULL_38_18]OGZ91829.1 MAG: crossover junction endodeoxyribonuclease RuvC [Candidatus Staskawiczbacteria bacterium RIFOXYD1_FULL_39_28]